MEIFKKLLLLTGIFNLYGQSTATTFPLEHPMKFNDFSIKIFRNKDEKWQTVVINHLDYDLTPQKTLVDVMQKVIDRDGKEILVSQICLKGQVNESNRGYDPLRFHSKGGRNIVVNEERTSAKRINEMKEAGFGGILTDRPLQDGELFEVRIDNLMSKYIRSLGIGISWKKPENVHYSYRMKHDTIMFYRDKISKKGFNVRYHYGPDLRKLTIGDRVGVMRKINGDLRFFVNGLDLGVGVSDVASPVYGVLDLFGNAIAATIV